MLRFLTGVSLLDRVSSAEMVQRYGLPEIADAARMRRLQWFGHARKRAEGEPLLVVRDWQVEGRRPRGRPEKS